MCLFEYFRGSLSELIKQSKQSSHCFTKMIISPVTGRLKNDLSKMGVDITSEYKHVIDNNAIRHTLNHHGGRSEVNRGQIPIVDHDFYLMADIVANYDSIKIDIGKRNSTNIRYSKAYHNGTTILIEEKRVNRKELATVTMWKIKSPALTDANCHQTTQISDLSRTFADKDKSIPTKNNELE